jgi:CRP-like cAMP-binding protein
MLLQEPAAPIEYVYFLQTGVGSVLARLDGQAFEVGLVGREGLIGAEVLLDAQRAPHAVIMQVAGSGFRAPTTELLRLLSEDHALRTLFNHFIYTLLVQAQATAIANSRARLEERLARWLLMVHDRVDGNTLAVTHEYLAAMLGVRRATVTQTLHVVEGKQLIRARRGRIVVIDRPGLEALAGSSYGLPEREYERLVGDFRHKAGEAAAVPEAEQDEEEPLQQTAS